MFVRLLGFKFNVNNKLLSLDSHINYLTTKSNEPFDLNGHKRHVYIKNIPDSKYYLGLLITIKDQKKFCELVEQHGKVVVKVNDLNDGSSLMDFNFFVINKKTGIGLYQYYHQSCSVNSFGYLINQRYQELIDSTIKHIKSTDKSKNEQSLRKKYRGRLIWEVLVKKENLKDLLDELTKIKSLECNFATLTVKEDEFAPLSGHVKKLKTKISFFNDSSPSYLAEAIAKIINKEKIEEGRIVGEDFEGIERILRIANNPDNFGEYNYDDIAAKINLLDVSKFEESWVIKELLSKCDNNKETFEAKLNDN